MGPLVVWLGSASLLRFASYMSLGHNDNLPCTPGLVHNNILIDMYLTTNKLAPGIY